MFNLSTLIKFYGPRFENCVSQRKVKLARHAMSHRKDADFDGFDNLLKFDNELLKMFTSEQGKDKFKDNELILVFVATESTKSLLRGAFWCKGKVNQSQFKGLYPNHAAYAAEKKQRGIKDLGDGGFLYHLEECVELNELCNRLVIEWGTSTQNWVQSNLDKKIWEIRPEGFVSEFPGWDKVFISHQELKALTSNPDGNKDWHHFLTQHDGVYVILDTKSGKKYVGSAYAEKGASPGIWGRWSGYAKTGHNNNKALLELTDLDSTHSDHFMYSIHHAFPKGSKSEKEIRNYEILLKKKLGTKSINGLNRNY